MSKKIRLTESEYIEGREEYVGYCTKCGEEAYGVEPDARRYVCESCGAASVYGIEELLMSGRLVFTSSSYKGAK